MFIYRLHPYDDRLASIERKLDAGQQGNYFFDRYVCKSWFIDAGRNNVREGG